VGAVPAHGLVVDLGCGPGREVEQLAARGLAAVGVDLSAGMLRLAARRAPGRVVGGDLRALPLRDGTCDGVWSSYALLHLSDADLAVALGEVRRVLRPGGTAVLVLASQRGGCEQVAYAPEHARVFHARPVETVTGLCRAAGLQVEHADTLEQAWRSPVRVRVRRAG
jgi:SAM-dependent methyltransferase